jgi:phage/plasmid-associated DNA primase
MDDALEKYGADADGQALQNPNPGDERHPLPAGGGEGAEPMSAIDWDRQQLADAIPIVGTPAEKHLVIHHRLRGPWPEALRWAPQYRPYPDSLPRHCLLAAATNGAGEIIGLQSTELDPLTAAKTEKIAKPRLSRGPVGEGSVFLGDRLASAATLVIGEGLEATLTRSLIAPCDAHACLGAVRFIEPAPRHTRVEILADSDKRDAARRLARQYAKDGRAAFVVTVPDSLGAKADLNDAHCQLGAGAVQMAIEDAERFTNEMARRGLSDFHLEIGSDIEIARRIVERLEELYGPIVVAEGRVWRFDHTHWAALDDGLLARFVHRADGAEYLDANGDIGVVRLNKNRIASILDAAMKYRQEHSFFDVPLCGINCVSGFIRIEADGSPTLQPHARQWRQRHVVRGRWPVSQEREGLTTCRLARYLREAFADDPDAADKINLLGEVAGCAALGWGTRVRNPKAIVTYSEEGATGKSTFLKLLRSLPNADAVASVPPGKFGDEKYAYRLIGRVLNAADELPDRAVRSDVFKRMITGEPVPARDVYRSACDFAPVALHVFSTNVLPSFSGGVDGGTVRRLLPIEFTHVVPEPERDPDLPEGILSEEADLFLDFAVEGACRLVRNRDFTIPVSSRELLQRWVLSADPVRAWAAARLEVTGDENTIPVAALFSDFRIWAEGQGLKAEFLPNVISFGKRLRSATPGLEYHRSDGSAYRNARIRRR